MDNTVGVQMVQYSDIRMIQQTYGWYGGNTDGTVEVRMVRWEYRWYD